MFHSNTILRSLVMLLLAVAAGCSKREVVGEYIPTLQPPKPSLHAFAISVTEVTQHAATLEWEPALDFHLDSIAYSIQLDGVTIASNLRTNLSYHLSNLTPDHAYALKIKAANSRGDSIFSVASFKTNDFYLKYARLVSTNMAPEDMAPAR